MATLLEDLVLEEVSLVDRPANPGAMIALFKRDDSQEENMDELQQEVEALKADAEAKRLEHETFKALVEEEIKTLKVERERLTKGLIDNGFTVEAQAITKAAPVEEIEVQGVKVNKADLPEVVVKALEAAQLEKADVALTKRATEALPNFATEVAKSLVKAFEGDAAVMEVLKAADKVFASKMEEVGEKNTPTDMTDPTEKLEGLVKAYQAEHKVNYTKAYAEVAKTADGKALLNQHYKKD